MIAAMRFHRDDRGQSVVLLAGALPLMLALLLVVVDGGRLYVERERIRNAAQLAAEAAVSLAADTRGRAEPTDAEIQAVVAEALSRNLPGEAYTHNVAIPFRSDLTTFNVKVRVEKKFTASIARIGFDIGADAAAKLAEDAGSARLAPLAVAGSAPPPIPAPPDVAVCFTPTRFPGAPPDRVRFDLNAVLLRQPAGLVVMTVTGPARSEGQAQPGSSFTTWWYPQQAPKYAGWYGAWRGWQDSPGLHRVTVSVPAQGTATFTFDLQPPQQSAFLCKDLTLR